MKIDEKIDKYLNEGKVIQMTYEIKLDIKSDDVKFDFENKKFDDKKLKEDIKKLLRKYFVTDVKFKDVDWINKK